MIKQFGGLFARLGLKREAGTRCLPLDAGLYAAVVIQIERKQMPTEELDTEWKLGSWDFSKWEPEAQD
jgi:hypothetical protein